MLKNDWCIDNIKILTNRSNEESSDLICGLLIFKTIDNLMIMDVYQSCDEFFYVRYKELKNKSDRHENYFKCDQLDGLLQLLKNKNII